MCLAVPAKIVSIEGEEALVDVMGNQRPANMAMLPEARQGDYVLLHAGFAITLLSPEEADESLKIWREYEESRNADH
jgi:hydrogenase expression/formation protein HypC